jgi:hypothetical protein
MIKDPGGARPVRAGWLRPGLLAAPAGGAVLAGCGGGSSRAGSGAGPVDIPAQLDAYAQCVRSRGVPDFYITHAGSTPRPRRPVARDRFPSDGRGPGI